LQRAQLAHSHAELAAVARIVRRVGSSDHITASMFADVTISPHLCLAR
jgi:hypothetical protein